MTGPGQGNFSCAAQLLSQPACIGRSGNDWHRTDMALENHDRIARSLDRIKRNGLISEYLVSWKGRGGRLMPKVTVWHQPRRTGDHRVRSTVAQTLLGLVAASRINFIAE